jgi:hypothetical protein
VLQGVDFVRLKTAPRLQMSMPEGYGMDLCCSIGGGGGGQSLNQPLDCHAPHFSDAAQFSGPHAQSPDLLKRQFSRNLRTLDPRGKRTERTFVLIYPWYNTARARGLPARRRGRICAHMSTLAPRQGAAPASPPARARHPRLRPLTSPPAASALPPLDPRGLVWSCKICARRTRAEGVKGGRRSCAVAVTRGWVVCAAK